MRSAAKSSLRIVVLRPRRRRRTTRTAKRLQNHVKATLAPYKYPRSVQFLDALPKTATGKIQRFVLRSRAKQ